MKEYSPTELLKKIETEKALGELQGLDSVVPSVGALVKQLGQELQKRGMLPTGAFSAGFCAGVRIGRKTDIKVFKDEK